MTGSPPVASDVVRHLNERFAERGLDLRIEYVAVLPYVNPMWMANWDVPQLAEHPEQEIITEEVNEARWLFPQVMEDWGGDAGRGSEEGA